MTVRMSAAKARQLGITGSGITAGKPKRSRKTAPGPYLTECVLCRERFTTRVGEDRHLEATGHPRYALVLS